MQSANFFAALDDSDDENEVTKSPPKNNTNLPRKPEAVAPSKSERRQHHNDRNTKTGRGGRAPARDGKRAYDRRSGTGRGREIKKGGGGARNWGSDKNHAKSMEGAVIEENEADDAAVAEASEAMPPTEGEEGSAVGNEESKEDEAKEEEVEVEEEDKTMSYEEYMASKQQEDKSDSAAFRPLQVKALEDPFAGMSVKAKAKAEEEAFMGGQGAKQLRKRNKKKEKEVVQSGFRVDGGGYRRDRREGDRYNRDRDRGDRRGRGGRGRGGDGRAGRGREDGREQGLNVQDENLFPSLG